MNTTASLFTLLLGFSIAISPLSSFAAEKPDSQADLAALRKQAEKLSAEINTDRKKRATLQTELRTQDLAIAKINQALKELDNKVAAQEKELKAQEANAQKLDIEIKKRQEHLAKSIRALHATGQLPDLKLLLNQQDPTEWQRMLTYYGYFNKALETEIKELSTQLSEQEQLRDAIGASKDALAAERKKIIAEQEQLKKQKADRSTLLTQLDKKINTKDEQLKELSASEKELQRVLAAIQQPQFTQNFPPNTAGNFAEYQGKLAWPTVGPVRHTFGSQRSGSQRRYDGIVISAPAGQSVKTVFSGRVVFADWLRGFGVLIIVDHGHHYMSLYAHNDSLFKKVGDRVQAGEQIATVGTTGGLQTPGLYFEIRQNGKPVNPQKWLTPKP